MAPYSPQGVYGSVFYLGSIRIRLLPREDTESYTPFLLVGFYSCPASVLENTSCPAGEITRVKTQQIIVRNGKLSIMKQVLKTSLICKLFIFHCKLLSQACLSILLIVELQSEPQQIYLLTLMGLTSKHSNGVDTEEYAQFST